jgi:adenylate cyclase
MMDYLLDSTKSPAQSLNLAIKYLEKAAALTDRKGIALTFLGHVYALKKDYDKSIELEQQAIALIPNGADAHVFLAITLNWAGRPEEALPLLEKAIRLNPLPPAFYYLHVGACYRLLGRFEDAIAMFKKSIHLAPNNVLAYQGLACTYGQMGREEEAKAAAAELLRINPKLPLAYALKTSPFKGKDQIMQMQGLRKAGLK